LASGWWRAAQRRSTAAISSRSGRIAGKLVKVLKEVAMSLSTSIWVMRVWEMRPMSSSGISATLGNSFLQELQTQLL
jgi:hypothetical protein